MTDQTQLDQLCIGPKEVRLAKEFFGWDPDSQFYVPEGVSAHFKAQRGSRGATEPAALGTIVCSLSLPVSGSGQTDRLHAIAWPTGKLG